jgi:hypothetical protein
MEKDIACTTKPQWPVRRQRSVLYMSISLCQKLWFILREVATTFHCKVDLVISWKNDEALLHFFHNVFHFGNEWLFKD